MYEVFVDGPGHFTSDGNNIKFTLVSVQKVEGDTFKPADVIQLVCTVQTASRIATFLHSAAEESKKPPLAPETQRTHPSSDDAVEERRVLGKTNVPHQT